MATVDKTRELENMLAMIGRLDELCVEYQGQSGAQTNRRLFQWMSRMDGTYDRAARAHAALTSVLSNAQIGARLNDRIEPQGANVQATLIAIRDAMRSLQDTFAAQLGAGIDARERERVTINQVRGWSDLTNDDAARTAISADVASLRTALAPLVLP